MSDELDHGGSRAARCDARHEAAGAVPTGIHDPARRQRGTARSPVESMRLEVEQRMRRGEPFTDVEDLIDATDLRTDEKSALWLLGWSFVHPGAQRREANAHLSRLSAATPPAAVSPARHLRVLAPPPASRPSNAAS